MRKRRIGSLLVLLAFLAAGALPATGHAESEAAAEQTTEKKTTKKKSTKKSTKKKSTKKKAPPPVLFGGAFAFEVIYDDNIIHYSDEDLYEFASLPNEGKFSITTADDWILRPRFDIDMTTSRLTGKPLSTRFRWSYWYYTTNDVKNNQSLQLRFNHPGFDSKDSFEFTLYYSPETYIRNFRDRPPYAPASQPAQYTDFSYTSNSFTLGYYRRWTSNISATVDLRRSIRYYNQAFMENDNWEWNIGTNVLYRLTNRYRIRGEYDYSRVEARGADEVGETREFSDDGDPSYDRDSYRLSLEYRPSRNRFKVDGITLSGQYQAYYFTSEKTVDEDPTHVGRKDQVYRYGFEVDTDPLIGKVAFYGGYLYTQRTSTSPSGVVVGDDIGEEKDYTDNRSYLGATYPLPF